MQKMIAKISWMVCALGFGFSAAAEGLSLEQAQNIVTPFYDALNQPSQKDIKALLEKTTSADWQSCSSDAVCKEREKVMGAFAGFGKMIPDLKWEIKEVLVAGDRVIVRGEASGTPAGEFFGMPHSGKSFKTMSIDVHTIKEGKITRSYHVEDWAGALQQLKK